MESREHTAQQDSRERPPFSVEQPKAPPAPPAGRITSQWGCQARPSKRDHRQHGAPPYGWTAGRTHPNLNYREHPPFSAGQRHEPYSELAGSTPHSREAGSTRPKLNYRERRPRAAQTPAGSLRLTRGGHRRRGAPSCEGSRSQPQRWGSRAHPSPLLSRAAARTLQSGYRKRRPRAAQTPAGGCLRLTRGGSPATRHPLQGSRAGDTPLSHSRADKSAPRSGFTESAPSHS